MYHINKQKRQAQLDQIKTASASIGSSELAGFRGVVSEWSNALIEHGPQEAHRMLRASNVKLATELDPAWERGENNAVVALDELCAAPLFQGYITFVKEAADDLAKGASVLARAEVATTMDLRETNPARLEGYRLAADWVINNGDDLTKLAFDIPAFAATIQLLADGDEDEALHIALRGDVDDARRYIKEANRAQARAGADGLRGPLGTQRVEGPAAVVGARDIGAERAASGKPSRSQRAAARKQERQAAKKSKTPIVEAVAAPAPRHMSQGNAEKQRRRALANSAGQSANAGSFAGLSSSHSRPAAPTSTALVRSSKSDHLPVAHVGGGDHLPVVHSAKKPGGSGLGVGLGVAGAAGLAGLAGLALMRRRRQQQEQEQAQQSNRGARKAASLEALGSKKN